MKFWRAGVTGFVPLPYREVRLVSGISGVQPKILVRDEKASAALNSANPRLSQSYRGATHIVKFWNPTNPAACGQ